jgi:hypothetical protein
MYAFHVLTDKLHINLTTCAILSVLFAAFKLLGWLQFSWAFVFFPVFFIITLTIGLIVLLMLTMALMKTIGKDNELSIWLLDEVHRINEYERRKSDK